jgi:hypothetical protein
MSDVVTGLFAVGGVVLGTFLEPVKNIFPLTVEPVRRGLMRVQK